MQFGLLISVLFHVAILGGALISIHSRAELRLPETEPVAVGMIAPGDVTKVKLGTRTAKLLEAAEAKASPEGQQAKKESAKPKLASAAPPPPPPPAADKADKTDPAPPKTDPAPPKTDPAPPKTADPPPPAPVPAAEALKKLDAQRKLEAEQKKLAEQQQKQAEEQRLAEEKKRAETEEKAETMRRAEAQKLAEEQKRLQEEHQKLADERKRAEEEQKRLEEQRKHAEELKKRKDEEKRLKAARERKEKQRKAAAEAKKRKLDEEKARQAAEASKKQFDADKIAALINKAPDKGAPPPSAASDQPTKAKGPTLGAAEGRDQIISASERAMIGQVIKSCVIPGWTVLSGGASAQETVVRIRLRFNKDGTFSAPPEITNPQETPYFRAISESALRAVQQCEPYNLPRSLYEHWKDINMKFSPKDMF